MSIFLIVDAIVDGHIVVDTEEDRLDNFYTFCDYDNKLPQLIKFLNEHKEHKFIVYFLTCASVDYFAKVRIFIEISSTTSWNDISRYCTRQSWWRRHYLTYTVKCPRRSDRVSPSTTLLFKYTNCHNRHHNHPKSTYTQDDRTTQIL